MRATDKARMVTLYRQRRRLREALRRELPPDRASTIRQQEALTAMQLQMLQRRIP